VSPEPPRPGLKARRIARLLGTRALPPLAAAVGVHRLRRPDVCVPLLGLAAWTVAEALSEHETSNQEARRSPQDRGTRHLVLGAHLVSWWLPSATLLLRRGRRPVSGPRLAASVGLLAAGATLRVAAVRELGQSFTAHVQVGEGHQLCRTGLYARVRHPSYTGLMLLNVAPSAAVSSTTALIACALTAYTTNRRVAVEEQALTERLGDAYAAYAEQVPRWAPAIRSSRGRDAHTTKGKR
jgi:protein-S-isoprenylcysteine O-methyltransferase Ste14